MEVETRDLSIRGTAFGKHVMIGDGRAWQMRNCGWGGQKRRENGAIGSGTALLLVFLLFARIAAPSLRLQPKAIVADAVLAPTHSLQAPSAAASRAGLALFSTTPGAQVDVTLDHPTRLNGF